MEIAVEIKRIVEERLIGDSQFVVAVHVSSSKAPQKVVVVVDGDAGVTIDDCATISRELSKVLDNIPRLSEHYVLEVSTPGLDQPLQLLRQYRKNIGRKLKVRLNESTLEGQLLEVTDENITLAQEVGTGKKKATVPVVVNFSEIDKTFVLVSFK
jgi:ribosome maturation factor RimP